MTNVNRCNIFSKSTADTETTGICYISILCDRNKQGWSLVVFLFHLDPFNGILKILLLHALEC